MRRSTNTAITFLLLLSIVLMFGCQSSSQDNDDPELNASPLAVTESVNLKAFTSEEQLVDVVKSYFGSALKNNHVYSDLARDSMRAEFVDTPAGMLAADSMEDTSAVSGTNLVEASVDEADLVKTDGQYLYVVDPGGNKGDVRCLALECEQANPAIRVMAFLDSTQPEVELLATLSLEGIRAVRGIYLKDDQLIVVGDGSKAIDRDMSARQTSYVASYNVRDKDNITLDWELEIEGYINTTRSLNGNLYLLTTKNFWLDDFYFYSNDSAVVERNQQKIEALTINDILPQAWLNQEAFSAVEATRCIDREQMYEGTVFRAEILSILTIPLDAPDNLQAVCTLESSQEVYATDQSIYLTQGEFNYLPDSRDVTYGTVIHKFSYTEDSVAYKASARIPGSTGWRNNAFRLSEQGDYLRVVVSDDRGGIFIEPVVDTIAVADSTSVEVIPKSDHRLYVLAEDGDNPGVLKQISVLPNAQQTAPIGKPGEDIYAVRYHGEYAYVVTFLRTDPVYAINLSDPASPFIEGELEIPGYSDYLHPIGDDLLLGIGKEAKMEGNIAYFQGVKVGLFDVSDKSAPTELVSFELGKRGSDTPVSHDYHAFTILSDEQTGVHKVAFPVSVHDRETREWGLGSASYWYGWSKDILKLYEVDDGNISGFPQLVDSGELVSRAYADDSPRDQYWYRDKPRSVIVDDAVHYISRGKVWSAHWNTPDIVTGPK